MCWPRLSPIPAAPTRTRFGVVFFAIRGYSGAEGTYNFDPNGDGLHGHNVVHNENGSWVFVEFPFQE